MISRLLRTILLKTDKITCDTNDIYYVKENNLHKFEMFLARHPKFNNDPSQSDNDLIKAIGEYRINDAMKLISAGYDVNNTWVGVSPLDLAVAIGDVHLVTYILTNGGKITPQTRIILRRTNYTPTESYETSDEKSSYSNIIMNTIENLIVSFSTSCMNNDSVFELGTNSSLNIGFVSSDPVVPNKTSHYCWDDYNIEINKSNYYSCTR